MIEKTHYTWKEFQDDIGYFEATVEMNNINHIVTLFRGGLPLSVTISNKCNLPLTILNYQSYDGNSKEVQFGINNLPEDKSVNILLVDDLADTGNSLHKSIEFLNNNGFNNIKVCTIHGDNTKHPKVWVYCSKKPKGWIIYPWE